MTSDNPLLQSYDIPALDKIKPEHFVPAIDAAIEEGKQKLAALKGNTAAPDFNNTVVALDEVFADISRVLGVLEVFNASKKSDALSAAKEEVDGKVSDFKKSVYQDEVIAQRFKQIEPTDPEDKVLYKRHSDAFEANGSFLGADDRTKLKEIDDKLISLATKFSDNLIKGTQQQAVLFTDPKNMEGLSEDTVAALRKAAQENGYNEGWLVIPERLLVDKLLESGASRNFRESISDALARVGTQEPYDNEPVIKEMQALRYERARLIDADRYPNYAEYALSRTMAGSLDNANAFMDAVAEKALPKFEDTVRKVQAWAAENGGPRTLEPYDLAYWANQYRKQNLDFDSAKFSEYLPLDKVTEGFFKTAEKIFGVTFTENTSYSKYNDDVRTYDVKDSGGNLIGVLHADFFSRSDKEGGAWVAHLQQQMPGHPNLVSMNMNLARPEPGESVYLTPRELETFFHEGGHALHALLGTHVKHPSMQGLNNGSSDYFELFSTILENWATKKEVLDSFAENKKGEKLPDELFEAMERSSSFLSERDALKVLQNARRDFAFHSTDPKEYTTSQALEQSADFDHPYSAHIRSYPLDRWSHLFTEGLSSYASGYYGYQWSQGLADAAYKPFKDAGDPFDPELCEKLKRLYSYGVSRDPNEAVAEYLGEKLTPQKMAQAELEALGADGSTRVTQSKRAGGRG